MALTVVITGVAGRMGNALVWAARLAGAQVVAGVERKGCIAIGRDVGEVAGTGVLGGDVFQDLEKALEFHPDVVIDFTSPEAALEHAATCAKAKVPMVIGTTGLSPEQTDALRGFAKEIPIVWAPNMSVGVNVVIAMAAQLAKTLGEGWDVEIVETHHRLKKDAPSGTAIKLADEIAHALARSKDDIRTARVGQIGERPKSEIGVQSLRGGDVVGEHTVFFFGDGERVELTHRATSREQFARGAMRAAAWVNGQPPGFYDMRDVLGFSA